MRGLGIGIAKDSSLEVDRDRYIMIAIDRYIGIARNSSVYIDRDR